MSEAAAQPIRVTVDGVEIAARDGQTVAGAMMAAGIRSWRTTARDRRLRGLFCGIGVCFDCLVTVNGVRDVRACQRRVHDQDVIDFQSETLPGKEDR